MTVYLVRKTFLHPSMYGAYTCLFTRFSLELALESATLTASLYDLLLPTSLWVCDH